MKNIQEKNVLIIYNHKSGTFAFPDTVSMQFVDAAEQMREEISDMANCHVPQAIVEERFIKTAMQEYKLYRVGLVCPVPGEIVSITFTELEEGSSSCHKDHVTDYDKLTGLPKRNKFSETVEAILQRDGADVSAGKYALVYLDVIRFKAINDIYGMEAGDRLLKYIAEAIGSTLKKGDAVSRVDADKFVVFVKNTGRELELQVEQILEMISQYELPFEISCNVGIYVTNEERLSVDAMIDRAVLAQSTIKGSYTSKYKYYTEELRNEMLSEQEISGMMTTAITDKQFVIYYQPQYNHSTGMLVGAEALVRWNHPERGLISPGIFIPIFEKNGFITKLDLYVFEGVCRFVRRCMEQNAKIVPISSNFSRYDIFQPDFVGQLEAIRKKYNVPAKYLRVEITESAIVGGSQHVNEIVRQLHECGYIVEMDDFGSGYSSLNVLKDIELDIIKLDMLFLSEESDSKRGGTILSAVVRMAKWLGLPVIAEGVETVEQADFLRSIGCNYIQGYLYSKPLQEEKYLELVSGNAIGATVPQMNLIETLNANDFWNPKSQETLIFSNYVGGAAIFDYQADKMEILRVNKKYLQELGMNLSEKELIETDPLRFFDEKNKRIYFEMLEKAIRTGEEQECETWRDISSSCCGDERICIRSTVRMIGKSDGSYLFYAMIRNVTAEKHHYKEILDNERRFKVASEQVNIYYWEYTVATHEMRPCFRCMRDLGLPALLTNYPDSAIEMGVFPPEVADMYRDWHRQIAEGVKELEAVMPLTVGRVPFRVKYTTEFDENGHPVKAYGSAALVV